MFMQILLALGLNVSIKLSGEDEWVLYKKKMLNSISIPHHCIYWVIAGMLTAVL